jgi:hypothetical protein
MADEDDDPREDPKDAEIRRLKSENDTLRRRVSALESQVKAMDAEAIRRRKMSEHKPKALDRNAASAMDRPWDGR